MNINILLDQDGVLSNFVDRTCKLLDADPERITDWNIPECLGIDPSVMWELIEQDLCFWENLDPYPWNQELIHLLEEISSSIFICTSPSLDPDCAAQKINWISTHLPKRFRRRFVITPNKYLLARPGNILIDDSMRNCQKFRKSGGQAILFPQPWNTTNGEPSFSQDEKVEYVRKRMGEIINHLTEKYYERDTVNLKDI